MSRYVLSVVVAAVLLIGFGVYAQTKNAPAVSTFKDSRDGKTYKTVKVDGKTWMAENLNFAAKGSACYGNKDDNCAKYGRLYNWKTAKESCPAGWRLPTDDEWRALVNYAGGEKAAGTKLKSKDWGGTNEYGFSALPGGSSVSSGQFENIGEGGIWWSATEHRRGAWWWSMSRNSESVGRWSSKKLDLFSVRCVQD
jgi:uncharacterized protein (TIGR02145 family)